MALVFLLVKLLNYTDHLLLTLLLTLGNLQVLVLTILHYLKTVVLRLKHMSKYLRTTVVYMFLVLTNLVTLKLVHLRRIENRTGAITFTGTVTISEVEFLKLKGGDVVVTGFDASNTLGGANSSDSIYLLKKQLEITSLTTLDLTSTNHTLRTLFLEHWLNLLILVRSLLTRFQHSDLSKFTLFLIRQQELLLKEHLQVTLQSNRIHLHHSF